MLAFSNKSMCFSVKKFIFSVKKFLFSIFYVLRGADIVDAFESAGEVGHFLIAAQSGNLGHWQFVLAEQLAGFLHLDGGEVGFW